VKGDKFFYLTTAIDYANGPPHIGHAFEKIGADAMVRYRRLKGDEVHFVIGMDEHGLKVLQSAEAGGITPQQWADDIAAKFEAMWRRLAISNDDFIRTTQPRHHRAVQVMVERMEAAGDLYRGQYEGLYCVGCEAFKTDAELVTAEALAAGGDVVPGVHSEGIPPVDRPQLFRCPIHPSRALIWMKEDNWFFRLSRYRDRLLKLLDERPEFVEPESRRNEIRRVLEGGLEDISVSRSRLGWGVPWPGEPEHTVYVWVDALINYLSAVGFPDPGYGQYWPADIHVIGKDITRFHCIYWPAMLMSAEVELPRGVWGHGFVTFGGAKVSKSEGGARLELDDLVEQRGPDALRYFLLREVPWNGDGEISLARFDERYTSDLANNVGNLANRVISMIERYREGVVPEAARTSLDGDAAAALVRYRSAMDANLLQHGAAAAIELAQAANAFVGDRAPWNQAKDPAQAQELDATLGALARTLATIASLLFPFMPGKMADLSERLGLEATVPLDQLAALDLTGRRVHKGDVLFPRPQE
jgi:methionyl-tRNA synthetase